MTTAFYTVYVDWDGDGLVDPAYFFYFPWHLANSDNNEVTYQVRANPGITTVRGRDQVRSLAPPRAGAFSAELDNRNKDYSPEYAASPLYGQLVPGRLVQVRANYGGTDYTLWTGYLDDIPQHPGRTRLSVSLPSIGPLSMLAGQSVSTALYASIDTGTAIGYVLDAAGWPAGDRTIDTGSTTLDWFWCENQDAISALNALLATEGPGACIYEDGDGKIVFESRGYRRVTARSTTSQATFRDTGAEPNIGQAFSYNPELKNVYNVARATIKTRTAKSAAAVWTLGTAVNLAPNEVRKYTVSGSDPFTNALTPASPTDYVVTSGSLASVALSRTTGQSTLITLTAGASGAVLTGLQMRADSVTVDYTTQVSSTLDATASIAKYKTRVYAPATLAEIPFSTAQDLCNSVVALYQDPRPTVQIEINNGNATRLTQILTREVSDRITIIEAQTGLDADFYVEQIDHSITDAGLLHRATFGCEKVSSINYAVWDDALWGTGIWGW